MPTLPRAGLRARRRRQPSWRGGVASSRRPCASRCRCSSSRASCRGSQLWRRASASWSSASPSMSCSNGFLRRPSRQGIPHMGTPPSRECWRRLVFALLSPACPRPQSVAHSCVPKNADLPIENAVLPADRTVRTAYTFPTALTRRASMRSSWWGGGSMWARTRRSGGGPPTWMSWSRWAPTHLTSTPS